MSILLQWLSKLLLERVAKKNKKTIGIFDPISIDVKSIKFLSYKLGLWSCIASGILWEVWEKQRDLWWIFQFLIQVLLTLRKNIIIPSSPPISHRVHGNLRSGSASIDDQRCIGHLSEAWYDFFPDHLWIPQFLALLSHCFTTHTVRNMF